MKSIARTFCVGLAMFAATLGLATVAGTSAQAAFITWSGTTVTHMANDGVAANNFAQLIGGTVQEAKHVDFQNANGNITVNDTVGSRSILFVAENINSGEFGADAVNTGDTNFNNALTTGYNNGGGFTIPLGAVNPLTINQSYTVQIWAHYGNGSSTYKGDEAVGTTFTGQISGGGNPATGNGITDNPWFVTGTFVADATTQNVFVTVPNNPWDAYLVTTVPVPEPSSVMLFTLGAIGLLRRRK